MGGLVDGMGFEEVDQAVTSTAIVSGTNVYGTTSVQSATISGANVYATTLMNADTVKGDVAVSGLVISGGATRVGALIATTSVTNADGLLKSASIGSPAVYNGIVQAGTIALSAGSTADVEFGVPFTSKKYAITFGMSGAAASACLPTLSGTATSSGATVIGDPSAVYYYVAVGY